MNTPTPTNPIKSRSFRVVVTALLVVLVAAVIFQAGMFVGYRRATFSYHWNEMYTRGPGDPHSVYAPFMGDDMNPNPDGASGEIVSVHLPEIMIKAPSQNEKVVIISPDTIIRRMRAMGSSSDLTSGTQVIVVGKPDDQGDIRASFVRIFPGTSTTPINK